MRNFKKYRVWELGMEISYEIYLFTKDFPETEKYGLVSQLRRSAISIPSNIAEGSSRESDRAFKRFVEIALGSAFEAETQLLLSQRVLKINEEKVGDILKKLNQLQAGMNSLLNSLKENG